MTTRLILFLIFALFVAYTKSAETTTSSYAEVELKDGGTPWEGNVYARNEYGSYGSVCDYSWDENDVSTVRY